MAGPNLGVKPANPRLNRGHPLSRDLLVCCAFEKEAGASGTVYRDLSDNHRDGSGSTTGTYVESEYGGAVSFAADVQHIDFGSGGFLPNDQVTACIIYEKNDGTNRASGIFGNVGSATAERIGVLGPFSDGVVYWDFGGSSGANRLSVSGETFERAVWVFSAGPGGSSIWKNGALVVSSATAITRPTAFDDTFYIGDYASQAGDNDTYHFFALFDRQLSSSEIVKFSADPFALVTPIRIPVLASVVATSFTGTGVGVIPAMVGVGTGVETFSGSGVGAIPAMVGVGTAVETFSGSGVGIVPAMVGVGVGAQIFTGTGTGAIPAMVGVGTASVDQPITGSGVGAIPAMVGVGVGVLAFTGSGTGAIPAMVGVGLAATANNVGSGGGAIPAMVGVGVGVEIFSGSGAGSIPAMAGVGVGTQLFTGSGVGSIPAMVGVGVASVILDIVGSGIGAIAAMVGAGTGNNGDGSITGTGVGTIPAMVGVGRSVMGTLCANILDDLSTLFGLSDFAEAATYIDRDGVIADKAIQVVVDRAETVVLPETGMISQEALIVHVPNHATLGVTRVRTGDIISVPHRSGESASNKRITRVISSNKASFEVEVVG